MGILNYIYVIIENIVIEMLQLTGEYDCKVDEKGRLRLPTSLLRQLGSSEDIALNFTVNRGFEKHLMLYPEDVWGRKAKEINQLNIYNTKQRQAIRYFYRGATKVSLDTSDRLLLPKSLMDYAGFEKDLVLFAYQEQIEIWSKLEYERTLEEEPTDFASIANDIFGQDIHKDIEG